MGNDARFAVDTLDVCVVVRVEGDLDMAAALLPHEGFAELTQDMILDPPVSVTAWRKRIMDAKADLAA